MPTTPDINLKEMKEEMLAKMEARIEAINEKFEVREGILIPLMDAHHAKTEA
jgi:translation elongation factor EF-1beta